MPDAQKINKDYYRLYEIFIRSVFSDAFKFMLLTFFACKLACKIHIN
jgi:hypothetical protein